MNIPDYERYTYRQLFEALGGLRRDAYPEVAAALDAEIARRTEPEKAELEEVYFRLDADRHPAHAEHLRELIEQRGGFDTIAPEVVDESNLYKTGWRRFWAMLIFDPLVFALGFSLLSLPLRKMASDNPTLEILLNFAADVGWILYFVLMHAICGQTIGKMITGVKVVRNRDLGPIRLWHALARESGPLLIFVVAMLWLPTVDFVDTGDAEEFFAQLPASVMALAAAPFVWGVLEILTMLFNKRRRALHDFLAGTVVVRHLRGKVPKAKRQSTEELAAA